MRAGEVAVAFSELRQLARDADRPELERRVDELMGHMEAVGSEDSFTRLVKDVFETVGEQRGFITEQREFIKEQRGFIQSQQTILAAATRAMESLVEVQCKANEIEERKLAALEKQQEHQREMAKLKQSHDQALRKTATEKILVPAISGIVGILTGALGAFLASSGATP
jgi:anion-transporting  ArsA/GET3 family ATPase